MMLNGSLESSRVTGAVWLDVARSESEKLIRSSVEVLILLNWPCTQEAPGKFGLDPLPPLNER